MVAADSTYQIIPSVSLNNTHEGCTGLQCRVVLVDDEADLFMEYQPAARSSRMLIGHKKFQSIPKLVRESGGCGPKQKDPYTNCIIKQGATDKCKADPYCRGRTKK
ncbi:unnamed protein product [Trifolium pratense]|uniref:Uncharacterized protein n=1 Tax=Trifolium pratense TaxID=57577 RepID=A0ACB0LHZ6_TRIPR|nr:unnamed protein product [Trifolium pratense]